MLLSFIKNELSYSRLWTQYILEYQCMVLYILSYLVQMMLQQAIPHTLDEEDTCTAWAEEDTCTVLG